MKRCTKCGQTKDESDFGKNSAKPDGLFQWCRSCAKEHDKKYRREHREQRYTQDKVWRKNNPDKSKNMSNAAMQKYKQNHQDKVRVRRIVTHALRDGKLIKKPCEKCGNKISEAHHDDYSKPLEVHWLCKKHHGELHRIPIPS